jgi:lipopolysaccharide/colanic/teichoic acid biosynthesis glycosyltransferase
VQLDRQYVRNLSFWHDIAIIWRTVGVVLRREGSY